MKKYLSILIAFVFIACSTNDKYSPDNYYTKDQQASILATIVTYIFIAPPYTAMKDRFLPAHRKFYTDPTLLATFHLKQYYVSSVGVNYFLVLRPGPKVGEIRAVGGHFKIHGNLEVYDFREIFVTPILPEKEAETKGAFLFDRMVKGDVNEYLKMKSYVQWPNAASYYDSTKYEWVLDPGKTR